MASITKADGWQSAGQGIGQLFMAMAQAPMARAQAQQDAALKNAQTYSYNMHGNKYGAEAQGQMMTNQARQQPLDASLPQYLQVAQKLFGWTGDNNVDRIASAAQRLQQTGLTDQAIVNPGMQPTIGGAVAAAAGKGAYSAVGDTGVSVNQFTGGQSVASPGLYSLHSGVQGSQAWKNRAQAVEATEGAGKHRIQSQGYALDNQGKAIDLGAMRSGQPLPSKRDFPGSNGSSEAARVRGTAEIIGKVLADPLVPQEEKEALIRKNIGLFQQFMGGGSPAPVTAVKNPAGAASPQTMTPSVPAGYKQIGTSGGKPVFQGPDGKRYIME